MSILNSILGNIEGIAAKVGLPADTVKSVTESLQGKMAAGGDQATALSETAAEHGLSVDKLKEMLGGLPGLGGEGGVMDKVTGFLDKDGDGQVMDDLTDMAKGLFGKK